MQTQRVPTRSAGLAAFVFCCALPWTSHAAPPTEVPDPERAKAARSQVALGFDPTLAPTAKSDVVGELQLKPRKNGDLRYVDPLGRFTADFHDDGTVTFADPWRRPSTKNPDRGVCCGRPPRFSFPNFNMSGPVEWLMYLSDQEPLRREKADLLARTRDFRTQMAVEFARARISEALGRLDGELMQIWADTSMSEAERRALLFARWDECDERFNVAPPNLPDAALSVIDTERVAAAEKARVQITDFISASAPAGSDRAFSEAELKALNASRMSKAPFQPYTATAKPKPAPK